MSEKMLQQILEKITRMDSRLENLEKGQVQVEKGQTRLEERQAQLVKGQTRLEEGQAQLEKGQKEIIVDMIVLQRKVNSIFEQTAGLMEFRTATDNRLSRQEKILEKLSFKSIEHETYLDDLRKKA